MPYDLPLNDRSSLVVLIELYAVGPVRPVPEIHVHLDSYVGIAAGVERSDLGDPLARQSRALKASLRIGNVPQKPERVQEIRFPGSVGPHEEHSALQGNV